MPWHVRLWLVVIIVRDKIGDGVFRKELAEFGIKLRGQRLVMRHDQSWFLQLLNDGCHRECFAGGCRTQQDLVLESALDAFDQLSDGFRLVTGGLEGSV